MAEAAGVALAVPAVIESLIKGGFDIYKRIEEARKIDETLGRYRQLGLDLHSKDGFLFAHLDALRAASRNSAIPRILENDLNSTLQRCKESQDLAIGELSIYDVDRKRSKWRFGVWGHSSLKKKYEKFKSDLDELDKLCLRISFVQQSSSNLLRPEFFKLVHENAEHQPGGLLPLSEIWVAAGNYEEGGQRHHGDFILERKYSEVDITSLCNHLRQATSLAGVLPCLGYRQPLYNDTSPPYRSFFQLVMELPSNTHRQSLAHKLYTDVMPPFADRIALARLLINAVSSVHSMNLVHKSIRSQAILLLNDTVQSASSPQPPVGPDQSTQVFLQDWTYVRRQTAPTSQNGTNDTWQRHIYEHPERQRSRDQFPETEFQPKHDIYSLGVVLMEIFLWTLFVQPSDPQDLGSEMRVAEVYEEMALSLGEAIIPQRYKGNSQKLTRFSVVIKDVWMKIAERDVRAVNGDIAEIILTCLDERITSAREVKEALDKVKI